MFVHKQAKPDYVPPIHAGMSMFPPSSSLLYLICSQKEVQLYLEIFNEKDNFKRSSSLQASPWIDNAEQEPL